MKFIPFDYQKKAIAMVEEKPAVGLLLDMGLGPDRRDCDHADCRG